MHLSWRARLEQQPELSEFAGWPMIPLDAIPRRRRRLFVRNQQIAAQVLAGERLHDVARAHAVTPARVTQLLDRCLGGPETEPPMLSAGLVPYGTSRARQRRQALPTQACPGRGGPCTFDGLLAEAPAIRDGLETMIRAALQDAPYSQRLSPQALHGEFKRLLAEVHWPRDRYPYTSASLAYYSLRRYLRRRVAELEQARLARRHARPRGRTATTGSYRAQRATQIDEHVLDLNNRVHLLLDDALIPLRLARASVLVAVDADTHCILGYHLALTRSPNQDDLLALLDRCVRPGAPRTFTTPGLAYAPGAAFPGALAEGFPISFGAVQLDNALMHCAHSVTGLLCAQFGATVSLGPPATPTVRHLVESVFDFIGRRCTHRTAATTGSSPMDPQRESRRNRKQPPAMTLQALDEALEVILTQYNVTPQAALGHATPLALFRQHCADHFVRFVPGLLARQWAPLAGSADCAVHWYRHEGRRPHIVYKYARYHGPGLAQIAGRDQRIRVCFDRRDIRTLHAYSYAGEDLGALEVASEWRRFPHSAGTRCWIHRHAREYRLDGRDPLAAYFRFLLEHRGEPARALALVRVYNEFTAGGPPATVLEPLSTTPPGRQRDPRWHSQWAAHRRLS